VSCTTLLAVLAGVSLSACASGSQEGSSSAASAQAVNGLLSTGIRQAQAKQFAQAQVTFQDVLVLDPGNEFAWYNLGLIAQTKNNPKAAVSDYQQAIRSDPRDTSAMYNEAIALEPTDRSQALSLYLQIVAINPKAATAYLRMSFIEDQLGDHASAAAARAEATALDPHLASVPPTKS